MTILPNRKQIRLKGYDYSLLGWYYITICTQNREKLFGEIMNGEMKLNKYGNMVDKYIQLLPQRYQQINLDEYQIMPNHVHFIIHIIPPAVGAGSSRPMHAGSSRPMHAGSSRPNNGLENPSPTLGQIVAYFKYQSTKQINNVINGRDVRVGSSDPINGRENRAPTRNMQLKKIWQRSYYEHIIRNEKSLNKIREYIKINPQMWEGDKNNPMKIRNYILPIDIN